MRFSPSPLAPSRFTPFHALAAGAVLLFAVSSDYWTNFFSSGPATPPPPVRLFGLFLVSAAFFGGLALLLWLTTCPWKSRGPKAPGEAAPPAGVRHVVPVLLVGTIAATVLAFGLQAGVSLLVKTATGVDLPAQNIVAWLMPGVYPVGTRVAIILFALFEAPLVEEPLFRGVVFRGLLARFTPAFAMTLSGLLFAIVHVNAASFVPLWFLGIVFAYAYWRTGRLLVPMAMHLAFNGTSLALFFAFPGLAS